MSFNLTLTGVDVRTDLAALPTGCEIGVLYTEKPEGRNRYPSFFDAVRILRHLNELGYKTALHVCGTPARESLKQKWLVDFEPLVQRIQVNGVLAPEELSLILRLYPDHEIITQHTSRNACLLDVPGVSHSLLVDGSGGRGISPEAWVRPMTHKRVGFAGGLGPQNIAYELPRIEQVATGNWWADMEGNLRDESDWFSVDKANQVADAALAKALEGASDG